MGLVAFTASTDLTTTAKRLSAWHLSQGAGANTINLRNGSASGAIVCQVQLPATTSASQSYPVPIIFTSGLYVEIVSSGFTVGSVDLV